MKGNKDDTGTDLQVQVYIDCLLKSHEQYFSYIRDEIKYQTIPPLDNFYSCQPVAYPKELLQGDLLTFKERDILNRRATHLCPLRWSNCLFDSSNATRGLLFRN